MCLCAQEKRSRFRSAGSAQGNLGCWRVSHVSLLIASMFFSADTKRHKNFWNSWYISTRDQVSLASAQSHHAAMSTSMSPTRCCLTPRTRLKQHGRQEHEPACEKMTCSFTFDLCRNERVLGKNLFPMGVEEAASQIHAHLREEPPHPFSQPSHARNFSRLTTRSQPIASTTSFNNCGVSGHVLFATDKRDHLHLWVGTASGMSSASAVSCCQASVTHVL